MLNHDYLSRPELARLGFATLGDDVRIHRSCVLVGCERISIGSHVRIDPFCIITISGGLVIGSHVHVSAHAALVGAGPIEIGDFANVSHGAKILSSSDHFSAAGIAGPLVPDAYRQVEHAAVSVGRHGIVGAGAVLLPNAAVGEGATIGALSLVKGAIPPWTVHAGVPARLVGQRDRAGVLALEAALRSDTGW
jgi:acetyltransferase-like isoleucine patch superfamily enzyme